MERTGRGNGSTATWGRGLALLITSLALVAACGQPGGGGTNPPAPATTPPPPVYSLTLEIRDSATLGSYVADKDGKALYVFTKDSSGTSACVDDCAGNWPPLTIANAADAGAGAGITGAVGTITRPDGSIQVTLGGAPLYYFAADAAAGDVNGQGVGDAWFLASPSGRQVGGAGERPGAEESDEPCSGRYCY
jgi:predicted lipoprotein with Yx(FWY)xxD motif